MSLLLAETGVGKQSQPAFITDWVEKAWVSGTDVEYTAEFTVDRNFGPPGAVTVVNNHGEDLYIKSISLTESGTSRVIYFPCHSFVDPFKDVQEQRVFFRNKVGGISMNEFTDCRSRLASSLN